MIQVRKRKTPEEKLLWFWDLMDDKGEILAEGLKGYAKRGACVKAAIRAKDVMHTSGIVEHLA